jgi:hypothetical protein
MGDAGNAARRDAGAREPARDLETGPSTAVSRRWTSGTGAPPGIRTPNLPVKSRLL